MIPKIIHYCWLSDDEMPDSILKCINSWKKHLTDYELILWDYRRFPRGKSKWVDQAFDCHKYAFAADYIRIYALYYYGGIYLDSDVEVIKPYNDLLDLPYFIGQEKTPSGIEAATMGFEPNHPLLYELLTYYENRNFIKSNNELDICPLPYIIRRCIEAFYEYHIISNISEFENNKKVFNVFTPDYFSPKHYYSQETIITENTYSIHQFEGSWTELSTKDNNPTNIALSTTKNSYFKEFLKKTIRKTFIRSQKVIISNSKIGSQCCHSLGIDDKNPFRMAKCSNSDFYTFVHISKKKHLSEMIEFIPPNHSKEKEKIVDYYPIVRIKGTNIEFHFVNHLSREQIRKDFIEIDNQVYNNQGVFIIQYKVKTNKWDIFKTCLKIMFGVKIIMLQ